MTDAGSPGGGDLLARLESTGVPVEQIRATVTKVVGERPEVAVVGAFAGGLLAAMILRRLGG
ncbi:MAG: hypothetical protein QOE27_190 [Solirubrobacteraceae bacterium]|jgi:hypothetical protein|nr:hypothetical protein [Solirubrobacteraceae bacterium]MEA2301792.1 hypothetical protein [Solirubrobacteraceae bacterium]